AAFARSPTLGASRAECREDRTRLRGNHSELNVFNSAELFDKLWHLKGTTYTGSRQPEDGQPTCVTAIDFDGTSLGTDEAGQYVQERRLPGAIWADQPDNAAMTHLKV